MYQRKADRWQFFKQMPTADLSDMLRNVSKYFMKCATSLCEAMVVLSLYKNMQIAYTQYVDNDVYVDDTTSWAIVFCGWWRAPPWSVCMFFPLSDTTSWAIVFSTLMMGPWQFPTDIIPSQIRLVEQGTPIQHTLVGPWGETYKRRLTRSNDTCTPKVFFAIALNLHSIVKIFAVSQ